MPNTAVKIRKTKDGEGTIYKLEPSLVTENGTVEYVIYKKLEQRNLFDLISLPATTTLIACVQTEKGFKRQYDLFNRIYEYQNITAQKAFGLIGYSVK